MKIYSSHFNQKQFTDDVPVGSWKVSAPKTLNKTYKLKGHTYQVVNKMEKRLPFFSLGRIAGIVLAIFCTLATAGLSLLLSKTVRQLFSGRQVLRVVQDAKTFNATHSFVIEGNKRAGNSAEIKIRIGKCDHLTLTEANLAEIIAIANRVTLNQEYPIEKTSRLFDGRMVHRPNHNGTHSTRQLRYLEGMFDLIEKKGLSQPQLQAKLLTTSERLNLKLAAYFLRAGRVDESSHKNPPADDYYTRSASIYEAYAKQLKVNANTIDWIKKLIIDSCKPLNQCQEASKSAKSKFAYDLLTTVHELDLVRCFGQTLMAGTIAGTTNRLQGLVQSPSANGQVLYDFSKDLCAATGSRREIDHYKGNPKLFADCSLDGKYCLAKVREIKFPVWN